MKIVISSLFCILISTINAQTGIIKGFITDIQSEIPLIGATVELLTTDEITGVASDVDGYFRLENVPVGRHGIRISYLGYESLTLPNILVHSGKDIFINITLEESLNQLEEVVISARTIKDQAQNELATISARQFSLEEVNRYSGGRSDVARLASNFAGVSTPNDSRNDIVIRGNSPTGVLWRVEGIPIASPNHFATLGTTGAPVSAINPNILRNSDFITSAFPAEYGNALAGVFDLGFRNGNKDEMEYTFQVGAFSGFEGMIEGPINKKGGSYLIAGRYSFVGVVGAGSTQATPNYQDLSFKVDLGQSPIGRFTIFGIGGNSDIDFLGSEIDSTDLFAAEDEDAFYKGSFGLIGLKHNYLINDRTYIRTIIGGSTRGNDFNAERYLNFGTADEKKIQLTNATNTEDRLTISSYFNTKVNARQTIRAGLLYERFGTQAFLEDRAESPDLDEDGEPDWFTVYDFEGNFGILQPYAQTKYKFSDEFSINMGLHGQYSTLNEQFVLEPRASMSYNFNASHKLTFGYGLHHQTAPLPILFINEDQNGELVTTNEDLGFVRSQHFIIGHDFKLSKNWRLKTELYYQSIDNAPVESTPTSYSTLNEGANFTFSDDKTSLVNEGKGSNRGIEITLEKFYSNGFYMLATGSFYSSQYKGSDGIERSTAFNNGYVVNLLGGREWKVGKKEKNAFLLDTKFTTSGGAPYTPVDLEASQAAGFEILREEEAYSLDYDPYLRLDIKLGMKINSSKKKISHSFYFDFQNVTNRENVFARRYNRLTNDVDQVDQIGFFPDFLYRVQF